MYVCTSCTVVSLSTTCVNFNINSFHFLAEKCCSFHVFLIYLFKCVSSVFMIRTFLYMLSAERKKNEPPLQKKVEKPYLNLNLNLISPKCDISFH